MLQTSSDFEVILFLLQCRNNQLDLQVVVELAVLVLPAGLNDDPCAEDQRHQQDGVPQLLQVLLETTREEETASEKFNSSRTRQIRQIRACRLIIKNNQLIKRRHNSKFRLFTVSLFFCNICSEFYRKELELFFLEFRISSILILISICNFFSEF